MAIKIVTVTQLKRKLPTLLSDLEATTTQLYVTRYGAPRAVVLKYQAYEALLERIDRLENLLSRERAHAGRESERSD
jgi:PHD/YefM family antitoxin component YafN of YafNO toxin-antitoxin module